MREISRTDSRLLCSAWSRQRYSCFIFSSNRFQRPLWFQFLQSALFHSIFLFFLLYFFPPTTCMKKRDQIHTTCPRNRGRTLLAPQIFILFFLFSSSSFNFLHCKCTVSIGGPPGWGGTFRAGITLPVEIMEAGRIIFGRGIFFLLQWRRK